MFWRMMIRTPCPFRDFGSMILLLLTTPSFTEAAKTVFLRLKLWWWTRMNLCS